MSIQFTVTCLDCKRLAPRLGDGGFLGTPSIASTEDVDWRGTPMPSFGYFYDAIASLGIRPYDLEGFREFLVGHNGHRVVLASDHDDASDYPQELLAMEQAEGFDAQLWLDMQAQDAERERRTRSGELTLATYTLTCLTCHKAHEAPEAESLVSFEPFIVGPDAVSMYLTRWADRSPDEGWNHRLVGLIDPVSPFMEGLGIFLKKHRQHPLEARLRESN